MQIFAIYFFFSDAPTTEIYTLSLHDALPICTGETARRVLECHPGAHLTGIDVSPEMLRSEEHTSELQSRFDLVCRLLLEKKKTRRCRQLFPVLLVAQPACHPGTGHVPHHPVR